MTVPALIGAKGGSSSFTTKPDTLRSLDKFEIVFGLGSGPWKGLHNGLQSLLVNNVPVEDAAGTENFTNITSFFANGDPTQTQIVSFKLGGGTGTTNVGTQLTNTNASAPGDWVTAAITTPNADHIDLRFVVQALYSQTKDGVFESTATLQIEMLPSGYSTWINVFGNAPTSTYDPTGLPVTFTEGGLGRLYLPRSYFDVSGNWPSSASSGNYVITGKTTSAAVRELRVTVPKDGPYANRTWQVRCRLVEKDTIDDNLNQTRRTVTWESLAAAVNQNWGSQPEWRGLAWVQIYGDASDQITGTPSIEGIYDTLICAVPPASVFNPVTRQYTGATWDGSYDHQFTDDPAWCLKAFIEDPVSGVAALSPGATLNKWDALEASKYYSQLVSDGKGGMQPRFSMNVRMTEPLAVEDAVQYIAGAVNSLAWEEAPGKWRLRVQKAENPVAIFTPENIVGDFNYSHTDVDTRYNDITMTFINEDLLFAEDRVRVYRQDDIDVHGRRPTSLVAIGSKCRQETLRRAQFRLSSNLNETQLSSWVTNRQGTMVSRYSTVLVADPDFGDISTTGRLTNISGLTLTCRDTVRLEVGAAYQIVLTIPNPNYQSAASATAPTGTDWRSPTITITRNITNSSGQRGDVTTLYVDSALPASTPAFADFALSAVGLPALPVAFQVVDIEPVDGSDLVKISGLVIYAGKYAEMDAVNEATILAQTHYAPPSPPTDFFVQYSTLVGDVAVHAQLQVEWVRPVTDQDIVGYRVNMSFNDGPMQLMDPRVLTTTFELGDPSAGTYAFEIRTVDRIGNISNPLTGSYVVAASGSRDKFGPLSLRPGAGNIVGDRFTTTDQSPNRTYVWRGGAGWVLENSLVQQGADIGVDNGATASDNLISNAGLSVDTTQWVLGTGVVRFPGAAGDPVQGYLQFNTGSGATQANSNTPRALNGTGGKLFVSGYVYRLSDVGDVSIFLNWYKGNGSPASTANSGFSVFPGARGVWTPFSFIATPPADASAFILNLYPSGLNNTYCLGGFRVAQTQAAADVTGLNTALDTLNVAGNNASTFAAAAATASLQAAAATSSLAIIGSDGYLSRGEKPAAILDWADLDGSKADLDAKATALGITAELTAWDTAHDALGTYLTGLSPTWNDTTRDTVIVAATWSSKWQAAYNARVVLLNRMAAVASTTSTWAGTTGTGKPADNATRNVDPGNAVRNPTLLGANAAQPDSWDILPSGIGRQTETYAPYSINIVGVSSYTPAEVDWGSDYYPVAPGDTVFLALDVYRANSTAGNSGVFVNWYDATRAYLTTTYPSFSPLTPASITGGAVWTRRNGQVTAPANAAYYRPGSRRESNLAAGSEWRHTNFYAGRAAPGADVTATVLTAKGIQDGATRNVPRGYWSFPTAYAVGDIVLYGSPASSYTCTAAHTSDSSAPPSAGGNWFVSAQAGNNGANALAVVAAPNPITIACDAIGNPKAGQLPVTIAAKVVRNTVDVTSSAVFALVTQYCTATDHGGGSITLDSVATDNCYLEIDVAESGQASLAGIAITKVRDGAAAASQNVALSATSSTGYTVGSGTTKTLPVGPNGQINVSISLSYVPSPSGAGGTDVQAVQVYYRTTPGSGSWVAFGSEVVGSAASQGADIAPGEPRDPVYGTASLHQSMSGPASAANWEFWFGVRMSGGNRGGTGSGGGGVGFVP